MKTTIKILLGLLVVTFCACSNSTTTQSGSITDKDTVANYVSNVLFVDGKFKIDTNAILNNTNLQLLIDELEETDLAEINTVSEIPSFISAFLDSLTGDFAIANSNEDWQVGCVILGKQVQIEDHDKLIGGDKLIEVTLDYSNPLPPRQLNYFGLSKNIALMSYYTGGWGKLEHILIFKFDDSQIIDFWCGSIMKDIKGKAEVLKYLKEYIDKERGLNTNIISI